jgi:NADPH:quinone reductase-like Zn-dependent oxidoreductase
MLAAYCASTGGDDPLANLAVGDLPRPQLRSGWALVRVEATSLNHHDLWTLRGRSSQPIRPPQVLGCDAAGVVEEYGPDRPANTPEPGTRVLVHSVVTDGTCSACVTGEPLFCRSLGLLSEGDNPGTHAEYTAAPAANLLPLPESVDVEAASCLPTAYLTAYRMLFTRARLRPGTTVLIQGASGGVATAATLLARAAGITVVVTSRDQAKRAAALQLGAAAALAPDRDAVKAVQAMTAGRGADAVLETVGRPTWELSLRAVRPGGAVVVSGATGGDDPPAQLTRIFWRHVDVLGSTMGTRGELEQLLRLVEATGMRPLVDRVVPLADARAAYQRMAAGEQQGKLVLRVA